MPSLRYKLALLAIRAFLSKVKKRETSQLRAGWVKAAQWEQWLKGPCFIGITDSAFEAGERWPRGKTAEVWRQDGLAIGRPT